MVYAIVRAGGRQEKVSVGDTIVINRVAGEAGDSIDLAPVLLVDGDKVTSAQNELAKVKVTAEVVRDAKGPRRSRTSAATRSGSSATRTRPVTRSARVTARS